VKTGQTKFCCRQWSVSRNETFEKGHIEPTRVYSKYILYMYRYIHSLLNNTFLRRSYPRSRYKNSAPLSNTSHAVVKQVRLSNRCLYSLSTTACRGLMSVTYMCMSTSESLTCMAQWLL